MTKQEYYDLLIHSAKTSVFPGFESGTCLYRADGGHKCAVGVLLTDEDMRSVDNDDSVYAIPQVIVSRILPEGMELRDLANVQECHDTVAVTGEWNTDTFIAELNGLPIFADVKKEVIGD